MKLKAGTRVKVVEYGGRVLERRVIADKGEHIVICPDSEYMEAQEKQRPPVGIGFPRAAIRDVDRCQK
jgi:hypothetical protein